LGEELDEFLSSRVFLFSFENVFDNALDSVDEEIVAKCAG